MDLSKGFKQTDIGAIPNDWDVKQLSEISKEIFLGLTTKVDYVNLGGVPLIRATDITNGKLVFDNAKNISEEQHRKLTKYRKAQKGDVLVSKSGSLGVCALVDTDQEFSIYESIIAIKPKESLNSDFLMCLLRDHSVQMRMIGGKVGSGVAHLNLESFRPLCVPLPLNKNEQEAIANVLSDTDAYIDSLEKLIVKKRLVKKGVMQELLSPKEDWQETTLVELCDNKKEFFDDGDWIEAEHITDSGVRLIQTGNIGVGTFLDRADRKYIFESSYQSLRCKPLSEGDLLICRLADPAGRACILPKLEDSKVITSVDVTICRPLLNKSEKAFLVQLFSTDEWLNAISERSGGTTHKRISRGSLGKLRFKIPALDEQKSRASILADMDADILSVEKKLQKARLLKQGMMQELLTGRIRLV